VRRLALIALATVGACTRAPAPRSAATTTAPTAAAALTSSDDEVRSNVTRADYAGSEACVRCHPAIAAAWRASPMHGMTRAVRDARLQARWSGAFSFVHDRVLFDERDGVRRMTIESAGQPTTTFRVTKVVGGHHREDYVGVEEVGGMAPAQPRPGDERVLPASWSFAAQAWRYKGYSVMTPERPGLRPGAHWSRVCIFCHNTVPLLSTVLGSLAAPKTREARRGGLGGEAPASKTGPYQGITVDKSLPPPLRATIEVTDPAALARAIDLELDRFDAHAPDGADLPARAATLIRATRARFGERDLVELGIGCESCHGGSIEHTRHPGVSPSYTLRGPLRLVGPGGAPLTRAQTINRVCARCHQVLFTGYPFTWEGGRRLDDAPGGSHINSGEARDLMMGGCATKLACTACHDPHAPDNAARAQALEGPAGVALCVGCHPQYASTEAQRAHSHHDPAGAGGHCFACHLPRKNMSLDNKLTRYHRVGSPTDAARVERDRPIECALCHAGKTTGALLDAMQAWWGKPAPADRAAVERLNGGAGALPLVATLRLGKAHEQAAALGALAEHARDLPDTTRPTAVPLVGALLLHPIPIVRYFADAAFAALTREPTAVDLFAPRETLRAQIAARVKAAGYQPLILDGPAPTAAPADGDRSACWRRPVTATYLMVRTFPAE